MTIRKQIPKGALSQKESECKRCIGGIREGWTVIVCAKLEAERLCKARVAQGSPKGPGLRPLAVAGEPPSPLETQPPGFAVR